MPDEPLRTITYTLTGADALAYEQATGRLTPLGVFFLLLWLGAWGFGALLVPADWAGPRFVWSFYLLISVALAIAYVLALLLLAGRQWLAARRRLRRPAEVTLTEWPGRLDLVSVGMPRSLVFAGVRQSLLTRTHLFLTADEDVVILPRRAFPEEGSAEALARRIEASPKSAPPPAAERAPVDPPPANA